MEKAPQNIPLTAWEAKERAGLLALETEEWREKRRITEDPNTTAGVLKRFAADVDVAWAKYDDGRQPTHLLAEALAAHQNTPPSVLASLIGHSPFSARAFCRNPVTPLLLLEEPVFVAGLFEDSQHALLGEATAPPLFVALLATGGAAQSDAVQKAARLHITFAGEAAATETWQKQLHDYWRAECAAPIDKEMRQWHIDLAELGLAPLWAKGLPPFPKPKPLNFPALDEWFRFAHIPGSPEEAALLQRIGPKPEDVAFFQKMGRKVEPSFHQKGLRADAATADLHNLLYAPGSGFGLVWAAILRHPAVDAEIITKMADFGSHIQRAIACHPKIPAEVLTRFLQDAQPDLRRLARSHPNAPSDASEISRDAVLNLFSERVKERSSPFVSFVKCLRLSYKPDDLFEKVDDNSWTERLEAVLLAPSDDEPLLGDSYGRTGHDLLHHLAHDGNRFVRWAAQTRLADPDFKFTWYDDATPLEPD